MANRELVFTLPDAIKPVSSNIALSKHPKAVDRIRLKYQTDAILVMRSQWHKEKMEPLTPPVHVHVTYFFKDNCGRDHGSYSGGGGSTKWIVDLLKNWAFTGDDTYVNCRVFGDPLEGMDTNETIIRVVEAHGQDKTEL